MSGLGKLNLAPFDEALSELMRCCGSTRWAKAMCAERPFRDRAHLLEAAGRHWAATGEEDWREAMGHHPRIGETQLREKFAATSAWSRDEQKGTAQAKEEVLAALAEGNRTYEQKFGFIFLVCATGKSADELLALLRQRLHHDPATELKVAADEQAKITQLRLTRLLST